MKNPAGQRRAKTAALVVLAIAVGASLLAVGVVLPALRAAEAEHQRAIRETPNYRPGYNPLAVVDELEAAKLAARVEQERRMEAEAELARLKAEESREQAMKLLIGDFPDYHPLYERLPRRRATPSDTDDPLAGLDVLSPPDNDAAEHEGEP